MKYLSFDIEATGLDEKDLIIEFAMIPFCATTRQFNESLKRHYYVKCPSFEDLKPQLNPWVIEHNKELIEKAHQQGIEVSKLKEELVNYFEDKEVYEYFENKKVTLFGKSVNAIDLPFMNRDLSWDFMRKYFNHRVLDLSCVVYSLIDMGVLPSACESGSELMKHLGYGEVAHTALEDSINTAKMYFKLLDQLDKTKA